MAALLLSLVLLLGVGAGGTLAWLVDDTDSVVNTFSPSNIDIDLAETKEEFKMIPGYTIDKDPKVTVSTTSEDCYLFVKLEKSANFDDFMTYTSADGWTKLDGENDVYYRVVLNKDPIRTFSVLAGNEVSVKDTVTKEMMDDLTESTYPTLTVTAYASQYMKNNTEEFKPAEAWENAQPNNGK